MSRGKLTARSPMHNTLSLALVSVLAALGASTPRSALPAQGSQGYWYESYRDGLDALKEGDWDRAELKLKDALVKRPEQGRNISVPGRRIDYLPEFHLGLVYVRQKRFQEAAERLERIQRSALVTERDPEFTALREALDECRRGNRESLRSRTVKIEAVRADGSAETGTGVVVSGGPGQESVYILTALHVLMELDGRNEPPKSIEASFYAGEREPPIGPVAGEWLGDKFNTGVDLVVFRVKAPREVLSRIGRWEYRETALEKEERVFTVGHAVEDYGVTETNVVLNPSDPDPRYFVLSSAGIGERASGGPVIDSRGYLAGLMVRLDPRAGRVEAVHVKEIRFWLDRWRVGAGDSSRGR